MEQRDTQSSPAQSPQEQSPGNNNEALSSSSPRQADLWNKDVQDTGRWGTRNKKELFIVTVAAVVMMVLTIVGVLVGTQDARSGVDKNNNNGRSKIDEVTGKRVSTFTLPTPPVATMVDAQGEWDAVREKFATNRVLSELSASLPATVAEIATSGGAEAEDPYLRAAYWLTSVDTMNEKEWAPTRYALASIYYATGGDDWNNNTNWLEPSIHHCLWHGVACCDRMQGSILCSWRDFYNVVELDLHNQSLVGSIPSTFALLSDLQSVFMSENALTGSLDAAVFEGMPYFAKLYLHHNDLTGTIPNNITAGGILDTLYVQGNRMTGTLPAEFCTYRRTDLPYVGVDCPEVDISTDPCFKLQNHCFGDIGIETD